jgi:Uma2 family endonuclease
MSWPRFLILSVTEPANVGDRLAAEPVCGLIQNRCSHRLGIRNLVLRRPPRYGCPVPIARKLATYEDVLNAPSDKIAQVINGELFVMPRPAAQHVRASSELGILLGPPFGRGRGGPGGWLILDEPELHLGNNILVPDLAGWRRSTMPEMPQEAYFETAPDWVCEVLSPSTELIDRNQKMRIYAECNVSHVWLVNPILQLLEVYELKEKMFVLKRTFANQDIARAEPFEAIEFELADLWSR